MSTSRRIRSIGTRAVLLLALLPPLAAEAQVLVEEGEFLAARTVEPSLAGQRLTAGGNPGALWSVTHGPGLVVSHHVFGAYDPRAGGAPATLAFRFDHRWPAYRNSSFFVLHPMILQGGVPYYAAHGFNVAIPSPLWRSFQDSGFVAAEFLQYGTGRRGVDFAAPFEVGVMVLSENYPGANDPAAREAHVDNFAVTAEGADGPVTVAFDTSEAVFLDGQWHQFAAHHAAKLYDEETWEIESGWRCRIVLSRAVARPIEVEVRGDDGEVRLATVPAGQRVAAVSTIRRYQSPEPISPVTETYELSLVVRDPAVTVGTPNTLVHHSVLTGSAPDLLGDCAICAGGLISCFAGQAESCLVRLVQGSGECERGLCLFPAFRCTGEPGGAATALAEKNHRDLGDRLRVLREVRDRVMVTSAAGRYYARLYQTLSPAIIATLFRRPGIVFDIAAAEDPWLDAFEELLAGRGAQAVVSQPMVDSMLAILDRLAAAGPESLRRVIERETARLQLGSLAGSSMDQFWQRVNALGGPLPCAPAASTLCLQGGRYQVETDWEIADGRRGAGHAVSLTGDTGTFWFFGPENVETVVKVLDGCPLNGRRWAFTAGLTDVAVRTTVTDTWTGEGKSYDSPPGQGFAPILDTGFASCGGVAPAAAVQASASPSASIAAVPSLAEVPPPELHAPCVASPTALCLQGGRFRVEAAFATAGGQTGAAQVVPLTADTGYLWFFSPSNVEAVVKVLDGCPVNDRFWVFAGGLTDVEVELRVTDTVADRTVTYRSPRGRPFRPLRDTGALAGCG